MLKEIIVTVVMTGSGLIALVFGCASHEKAGKFLTRDIRIDAERCNALVTLPVWMLDSDDSVQWTRTNGYTFGSEGCESPAVVTLAVALVNGDSDYCCSQYSVSTYHGFDCDSGIGYVTARGMHA